MLTRLPTSIHNDIQRPNSATIRRPVAIQAFLSVALAPTTHIITISQNICWGVDEVVIYLQAVDAFEEAAEFDCEACPNCPGRSSNTHFNSFLEF